MSRAEWDDNSVDGLEADFVDYMNNGGAVFTAWNDNTAIGFAQCGFRHDYVEGTETSPVGYIEGVFVEVEYRRQGIARELVRACQIFAKEQGCTEFASDCELDNEASLQFHLKMGFCQTAHCGRCQPHFDFGVIASPIVPYRNLPQTTDGITADCRSFV